GTIADGFREGGTVNQLEDERADAARFFQPVNRADVRMIERREELRFLLEAGQAVRTLDEARRQDFQRDVAIQLGVARAIHLAHPARPDGSDDLVRTEAGPGSKGQGGAPDYTAGAPLASRKTLKRSPQRTRRTQRFFGFVSVVPFVSLVFRIPTAHRVAPDAAAPRWPPTCSAAGSPPYSAGLRLGS